MDISEFICGFLEMIKASEDKWKSTLVDYLHLIMEKAIHYQWSAVRNFHHAISSAVEQNRLSWDDLELIRMKSNTHFSHADLRVTTVPG